MAGQNEHWLVERLNEFASSPAMIWRGNQYSFADIRSRVDRWREDFRARKVAPGESVAILGDYSPDTCSLLLALVANGNIAVPLTAVTPQNRDRLLTIPNVTHTYEFASDGSWSHAPYSGGTDHPLLAGLRERNAPGLVLYTTGSTGNSKAALHDFDALLEKFKTRRPLLRSLTFLLLDHIGGVNTLFSIFANGGTAISLEQRTPEVICAAVEKHKIEVLPVSPTFCNMLLMSRVYERYDLSSLRLVTYGTEPMPETTLARLNEVFPKVKAKQTYGLTELGIFATQSRDSTSLWVKVGGEGVETKIVDGVLYVRTRQAMLGYLNAPSPYDAEGWFNTQDHVLQDGEYLRILGRTTDVINVGGEKVYPSEVESVLLQMPNVKDVTIRAKKNAVTGNVVCAHFALFEPEELGDLRRRMVEFCGSRLARYKIPLAIEIVSQDQHNARFKKIRTAT